MNVGLRKARDRTIIALAVTLGIVLSFLVCFPDKSHGFKLAALRTAIANKDVIDLTKFTPFEWGRVFIFGSYTLEDQIKTEVGTAVSFPHSETETDCLLVFSTQGKVVSSIEVRRQIADFSELYRKNGYRPTEAVFRISEDVSGRKKLTAK